MGQYIYPNKSFGGGTVSGDTVFSAGVSAGTINITNGPISSGGTDLYSVFATVGSGGGSGTTTNVHAGTNTFVSGTLINPSVNITSATLANLSVSGTNTANQIYASTLSGGTIYSGNTDLYSIFSVIGSGGSSGVTTNIQNGLNTFTGGTNSNPSVNITSATLNNLVATGTTSVGSFSATTIYSGNTNLYSIFAPFGVTGGSGSSTFVQSGINTFTGGTNSNPSVNITSATLNNLIATGTTSIGSLSATTIYSGSTNLYSIFAQVGSSNGSFSSNGINTFTGGTSANQTINITSATLNNLVATGTTSVGSFSATTIYSGSTDIYNIFINDSDTINGGTF